MKIEWIFYYYLNKIWISHVSGMHISVELLPQHACTHFIKAKIQICLLNRTWTPYARDPMLIDEDVLGLNESSSSLHCCV